MFRKWFGNNDQAVNTVQGYLHASNQIEAINQQLEDAVAAAITQGATPWDAYAEKGYALAFVRACRCHVLVVQAIVQAPAPNTALPRDAYNQALALSDVFEPYLEEAIKAQDPRYRPRNNAWPLQFGPRLQETKDRISIPLVKGLRNGGQQVQEWVTGFIATYELAVHASTVHPPTMVDTHLETVHREMQLGTFHFQTAMDMLSTLSTTQVAQPMLLQATDLLWEALGSFFIVSQVVAHPGVFTQPQQPRQVSQARQRQPEPPQQITYLPTPTITFVQPPVSADTPAPEEQPYGEQEAAALLTDFAQMAQRPRVPQPPPPPPPTPETMLGEFVQQQRSRPKQQPTSADDLLADIVQQPKQQTKPQMRNEDTGDLLSDITGDNREPLL